MKTDVYVTLCLHARKSTDSFSHSLHLAGLPAMDFLWMVTPEVVPGQIVVVASCGERNALYVLDRHNMPFQIAGTRDLLLDAHTYCDLTTDYQRVMADLQHVIRGVFMELSLQEMRHCAYLSDWEWNVKEHVMSNKLSFSDIIEYCLQTLSKLPNSKINERLCNVLNNLKRNRLKTVAPCIDWGDYDIKSQTEKPATD